MRGLLTGCRRPADTHRSRPGGGLQVVRRRLLILGPLLLVAAVWAVLVVVSNTWDKGGRLRGWHDNAAKTLVFDVKAGRNPITTGGIQGPYSFAPLDLPPVQQVLSPVAGARAPQVVAPQAPAQGPQPVHQTPAAPAAPAAVAPAPVHPHPAPAIQPDGRTIPARPLSYASPASFAPPGTPAPDGRSCTARSMQAGQQFPAPAGVGQQFAGSSRRGAAPGRRRRTHPDAPGSGRPRRLSPSCGSGSTTAATSSSTAPSWWAATPWAPRANSMPSSSPSTTPAGPSPRPTCTS